MRKSLFEASLLLALPPGTARRTRPQAWPWELPGLPPNTVLDAQLLAGQGKQLPRCEFPGPSSPVTVLLSPSSWVPDTPPPMRMGAWTGSPHNPKTPSTPQLSSLLKGMEVEDRAVPAACCPRWDWSLSQESARPQGPLRPQLWALCSPANVPSGLLSWPWAGPALAHQDGVPGSLTAPASPQSYSANTYRAPATHRGLCRANSDKTPSLP